MLKLHGLGHTSLPPLTTGGSLSGYKQGTFNPPIESSNLSRLTNLTQGMKMRNLIVHMSTGYYGSDGHDVLVVVDQATDAYINSIAWQMAVDHAESYGFELGEDDEDTDTAYTEDMIEFMWDDYDPEVHDKYRSGGGSFADEFKEY
jgi:hypothetical protein